MPLAAGEDFDDADFGYQQQDASIGDFVWDDLDGNGVFDAGEPGLAGVTVYLDLNGNGVMDAGEPADTSDGSGAYDITDLPTGNYSVRVGATPANYVVTSGNDPQSVPLATGEDFDDADFGLQLRDASIGDFVWLDLNGDGVQDAGEPGIADVTVVLRPVTVLAGGEDSVVFGPPIGTETTDGNGFYDFTNLAMGAYVAEVTDDNNVLTGYIVTGGTHPHSVNLAISEDYNDADFGFCLPVDINQQPNGGEFCEFQSLTLTVVATGSPTITYQWRKDGVDIDGETGSSLIFDSLDPADTGSYDCVVENGCASLISDSAVVDVFVLDLAIWPPTNAQGLTPLIFEADFTCAVPPLFWEWANLTAGTTFGTNQNPVTLPGVLTETSTIEITLDDNSSDILTDRALVLVSQDPFFLDVNGDGCNTIDDLWEMIQLWLTQTSDPNGDGIINVQDLLYINLDNTCED